MRNIYEILSDKIRSWIKKSEESERPGENGYDEEKSLLHFLNRYEIKHHEIFKSLAAMDRSDMFTRKSAQPKAKFPQNTDPLVNRNVPAVLTVQYNPWKYKNDTEALAGMAVEISKELEGIMTQAQWLSTCWRNSWKKKKYIIWIEFFFPCLLALVLACSFTWIAWVVLDSEKFKEWANAKYAWPPAAMVIVVWKITKSVVGILKPVSNQLINYISLPDHTKYLGYQERVISDIQFLKGEIGEKPYSVFTAFVWVFNTLAVVWRLITKWSSALFFHSTCLERDIEVRNVAPASGTNLRIIVFVDDLDRCQESVILQVLSAINLVLSVCQISVVLAMDKELIQKAIIKKYGDVKHKSRWKLDKN
ncbi:hypothetical protein SUGI_0708360 [Cryptomeria japonica]|nr:hypothetical protein SUGI_0708360 [Cryptomeria japonica]